MQNESKRCSVHTPGPWTIVNPATETWGTYNIQEAYEHISGLTQEGGVSEEQEAVDSANIRLIAAAPELLEALEFIVTRQAGDLPTYMNPALEKARAAIAKARGEEKGALAA